MPSWVEPIPWRGVSRGGDALGWARRHHSTGNELGGFLPVHVRRSKPVATESYPVYRGVEGPGRNNPARVEDRHLAGVGQDRINGW
jgi:hypothetical protein